MDKNSDVEKMAGVTGIEKAMLKKALVMHSGGNLDGAIACYKVLITHFRSSDNLEVLHAVAYAMYELAYILILCDNMDEGVEVCDALIARFCDNDTPMVQQMVTYAMLMRATVEPNSSIDNLLS